MPSSLEIGDAAVAAGSPLAAEAAISCLRNGGNAVDAAVAASGVQCVTEPGACGVGGDLFALIHSPTGQTWAINGSGCAPSEIESVLDGKTAPRFGPLSVSVPGTPAAWDLMLERFGSMPLSELLQPAIDHAREGFPLYRSLGESISRVSADISSDSQLKLLFRENPSQEGSLYKQESLGHTLEILAQEGARSFYTGSIAESIIGGCQSEGGVLSADDLAQHKVELSEPITAEFGTAKVLTQPPVSMGLVFLMELQLLEKLRPSTLDFTCIADIDLMVRCKHAAFADGFSAMKDGLPETWAADTAKEIYAKSVEGTTWKAQGTDTTCVVVADGTGLVVSLIHSLFNEFGSRLFLPDTGVLLNDRLANQKIGSSGLAGGERSVHTLHSYLLLEDDQPRLMSCTPGGRGQPQINFQIASQIMKGEVEIDTALDAPRWLSGNPRMPHPKDTLFLEEGFSVDLIEGLKSRGHLVHSCTSNEVEIFGSCLATGYDRESSKWFAAADSRRDAKAIALNWGE